MIPALFLAFPFSVGEDASGVELAADTESSNEGGGTLIAERDVSNDRNSRGVNIELVGTAMLVLCSLPVAFSVSSHSFESAALSCFAWGILEPDRMGPRDLPDNGEI